MRDSDLIRKLLKGGLTYRANGTIAKSSHGLVHQDKLAMKRDEEAARIATMVLDNCDEKDASMQFPKAS